MTNVEPSSQILGSRVLGRRNLDSYRLRLAESDKDIRAAQTLRFLVFNLELNEGLEGSFETCLDADAFDPVCDHLLVENLPSGEVVGTYRLQTGATAASNLGFYSATEFDLSPFRPHQDEIVELGRACVHAQHRNLAVLGLLWKGIADYARARQGRYLIGCSSLPTADERIGAQVYQRIKARHAAPPEFQTVPLESVRCRLDDCAAEAAKTPKLLAAYLSLGAKICAPPAVDREFRTIDFLTLLDLNFLPESVAAKVLR